MLIFAYSDTCRYPYQEYLNESYVLKLSQVINIEILKNQNQPTALVIPTLVKMMLHYQDKYREFTNFPVVSSVNPLEFK